LENSIENFFFINHQSKETLSEAIPNKKVLVVPVLKDGTHLFSSAFVKEALVDIQFKMHHLNTCKIFIPKDLRDQHFDASEALIVCIDGNINDEKPNENSYLEAGAVIVKTLWHEDLHNVIIAIDSENRMEKSFEAGALIAAGAKIASFNFTYKTLSDHNCKIKSLTIITDENMKAEAVFKEWLALAKGMARIRRLALTPPNILYPEVMAKEAQQDLASIGVKVKVLGEKEMQDLGMGALLGVAQGSVFPPRLVALEWMNGDKDQKPLAFVGKGVTFDSGGISIKPAANMEEMKTDMIGAATVFGLIETLALRKAKVNAVGVMGIVENMPSANAQRPADLVKTMSGQTVEVIDTDAEGRLLLADALWYAKETYNPQLIIDLATLTGSIFVALGEENAGLFSNNDDLADKLKDSGAATKEHLWRMPLSPIGGDYDKQIDCDVADMQNIGSGRPDSIHAAQFLQRFVGEVPWAHLDIAGVAAYTKKQSILTDTIKTNDLNFQQDQYCAPTAFGLRLLNDFVRKNHEGK